MNLLPYKEAWMANLILAVLRVGSRHKSPHTPDWLYNMVWHQCKQTSPFTPAALIGHKRNSHELMLSVLTKLIAWDLVKVTEAEHHDPFRTLLGWHGMSNQSVLSPWYQLELFVNASLEERAEISRSYLIKTYRHTEFVYTDAQWQEKLEAIYQDPRHSAAAPQIIYTIVKTIQYLAGQAREDQVGSGKGLAIAGAQFTAEIKRRILTSHPFVSPLVVLAYLEHPFVARKLNLVRLSEENMTRTDSIYTVIVPPAELAQHECLDAIRIMHFPPTYSLKAP